jgi:hypothetical protein
LVNITLCLRELRLRNNSIYPENASAEASLYCWNSFLAHTPEIKRSQIKLIKMNQSLNFNRKIEPGFLTQ